MSRISRLSVAWVLIGVTGGLLAGCGGSSSGGAKSSSPATSSSEGGGSVTTTSGLSTTPKSDPLLAKAALTLADVGPGYSQYRKGTGATTIGKTACLVTPPGAILTPKDAAYGGAMFKKKGATYFAYSTAFVFRTEAQAKAFATFRASSGYKRCQAREDDTVTRKSAPDVYVKLTSTPWSDASGHVPTMYREMTGVRSTKTDNGFYDRYTVHRGRVVIVVYIDSDLGHNAAESQAIANQTGRILRSFDAALDTRLAGA